jgi:hypothetical protein
MLRFPARSPAKFGAIDRVTVPLPLPPPPAVIVIQGALDAAFHAQPSLVVTVTVWTPPLAGAKGPAEDNSKRQAAGLCCTCTRPSFTTISPWRGSAAGLAFTRKEI